MASRTPLFIHNENLPSHRGKVAGDLNADLQKPLKQGLLERKALRDLSNAAKPPVLGPSKASAVKEKSSVKEKSGVSGRGTKKTAPKSSILADEQIEKCREWAKEGIEQAYFTGNDIQKLLKDREEERVRKEVEKVMSAMREWTRMNYIPKIAKDTEDDMKLKLVPEELPPRPKSGKEEIDELLDPELDLFLFPDSTYEFKLKEDQG